MERPDGLRDWQGFDGVGSEPCDDLETVMAARAEVRAGTRALLDQLTPELRFTIAPPDANRE